MWRMWENVQVQERPQFSQKIEAWRSRYISVWTMPIKVQPEKLLNKHVKTIHGSEEFPCPTCGKVFNQKSNMKRHSKMHEVNEWMNDNN